MGIENITDRIIAEAEDKAREIIGAAEEEARKIISSAEQDAERNVAAARQAASKQAEQERERIAASARMEGKKLLLETKQALITEAFDLALQRLETLSDEEFERVISALMVKLIETGSEQVIINEKDKRRLKPDFLLRVNQAAAKNGVACNVTMSDESRDISSGFILKRGDVEINATFETLLRQWRDELSSEVAKILF